MGPLREVKRGIEQHEEPVEHDPLNLSTNKSNENHKQNGECNGTYQRKDIPAPRKKDRREKRSSLIIGVIITFLVCVFDATSISCLQLLNELPPDIQINALSFSLGFVCILVYTILCRKIPRFAINHILWVIAICVIFITDNLCLYNHEASFLPLGSIGSLGYAFALIFSVILSRFFLKELITIHKGVAVLVTLTGLVLTILAHIPKFGADFGQTEQQTECTSVIQLENATMYQLDALMRPNNMTGIISNSSHINDTSKDTNEETKCDIINKHSTDFWTQFISMLLLAVSCFCSAMETVMLSGSRIKHEKPTTLAFWIFLAGSVILIPSTFILEDPIIPERTTDLLYLLGYSICSAGLTFAYIVAAQHLMPMVLSIMESFGIPLMFVVQILLLRAIAMPSNLWLQIAGIVLVFFTTVALPIIEYYEMRKVSKQRKANTLLGESKV